MKYLFITLFFLSTQLLLIGCEDKDQSQPALNDFQVVPYQTPYYLDTPNQRYPIYTKDLFINAVCDDGSIYLNNLQKLHDLNTDFQTKCEKLEKIETDNNCYLIADEMTRFVRKLIANIDTTNLEPNHLDITLHPTSLKFLFKTPDDIDYDIIKLQTMKSLLNYYIDKYLNYSFGDTENALPKIDLNLKDLNNNLSELEMKPFASKLKKYLNANENEENYIDSKCQ